MFRLVQLPSDIPGSLYLNSMLGRYESMASAKREIKARDIRRVIGLVSLDEIERKSPEYASALASGNIDWDYESYPILDFGAPADKEAFFQLAHDIANNLRAGNNMLIHCAGGVGRTGMLAVCILLCLGMPLSEAKTLVDLSGSYPETPEQWQLIDYIAGILNRTA